MNNYPTVKDIILNKIQAHIQLIKTIGKVAQKKDLNKSKIRER